MKWHLQPGRRCGQCDLFAIYFRTQLPTGGRASKVGIARKACRATDEYESSALLDVRQGSVRMQIKDRMSRWHHRHGRLAKGRGGEKKRGQASA